MPETRSELDALLTGLRDRNGSDLYLTAESPPLYRVDGATLPCTKCELKRLSAIY